MESIDPWMILRTLSLQGGEEEGEGEDDGEAGEGDDTEMMSHGLWFSVWRGNGRKRKTLAAFGFIITQGRIVVLVHY